MFRPSMEEHAGMLFIYDSARRLSFWMRNTQIPLDIGYFDPEGVLQEVHRMYPNTETSVPSNSQQIQFALEMNQGWFTNNHVKPGHRLSLDSVAAALSARGFNPRELLKNTD
jgi:uncharacterized membrane protein (UPF0127 family)